MNYERRAFALLNGARCEDCKYFYINSHDQKLCVHTQRAEELSDCVGTTTTMSFCPLVGYCGEFDGNK